MINLKSLNNVVSLVGEYKIYVISITALITLISTVWIKCDNDRTNTLIGENTGEIIRSKDTIQKIKKASEDLKVPVKEEIIKRNKSKHDQEQDNDSAHF